ncbi:MAG: ABC transporter substrate-binding protein [Candidatus Rokubacteria bacterium]|nr:ABC transporter substrate-binding protein [Candidatus Rokubacteria bacterium]
MVTTRRHFLTLMGGAAAAAATPLDTAPAFAQSGPVKIGVLAIKAGVGALPGEYGLRGTYWATDRINAAGGILGRKIELLIEEESSPKDTVERFRKLALQNKADVIVGVISTGVGLAIGPVAEELKTLWLSWDGTTQKGVEETMPKPKYAFRSCDNESEAVMSSILTAKHFKGKIKTVAGINPDYSYGRDNWAALLAIMKKYEMGVTPVTDLWPKLGTTDFTSHVAALQQAKPDLIFSSLWAADVSIFLKQAHAVGLTAGTKFVFPVAGLVHETLKKAFTPEGMILGYNTMYFEMPNASPLLKQFTKDHFEKYKEWPSYESDHAYFVIAAYKAAIERAAKAIGGKWPSTDQIIQALEGIEVQSLSGTRRYRQDHIMEANFYQGLTTHKNKYDFVTIDPVEVMTTTQVQKPSGMGLYDWINGWKV